MKLTQSFLCSYPQNKDAYGETEVEMPKAMEKSVSSGVQPEQEQASSLERLLVLGPRNTLQLISIFFKI